MSKVSSTPSYRYYDIILAAYAGVLLISNLGATKLIEFGSIITDGGAILFPLTYIFGDILTEVYGYQYARRAIWTGFIIMLLAVMSFTIVQHLPAAPEWGNQSGYESILGFFPRIVLASLTAYIIGEFMNAYVLAKMKVRTKGKYLGGRLISSTVVGQFADTIVFSLVAFSGILGVSDMLRFILIGWIFKVSVEIVFLPITYKVVSFLKVQEKRDAFDKKTNFNPLKLGIKT
jgi:uncharacterized integral membrane protein (TIGR00697 family)